LDAAHLATQTIVESILPRLMDGRAACADWTRVLVEGVQAANRAIYLRNQSLHQVQNEMDTAPTSIMGTTVTGALLLGETAYVVNVGDSRTYLYQSMEGLTRITVDHSLVANLFHLAEHRLTPEGIYTHPQRNHIFRALGTDPCVEVDTFVVPLHADAILLLCSDGLWEMTRDGRIEEILESEWATASTMAKLLLAQAYAGGGRDNVGLVVVQVNGRQRHSDIGNLATITEPIDALSRLVPISSAACSSPSGFP
jgi:serine/threonine protein phosphatase PrpC